MHIPAITYHQVLSANMPMRLYKPGKDISALWKQLDPLVQGQTTAEALRKGGYVGALVIPWENPIPEEKIESIDIISSGNAIPVVIAVTGAAKVKKGE